MRTPIFDFVKKYAESNTARFHMPGHKGKSFLGCEKYDLTEIFGADTLYSADGIIDESEKNASKLFGTARTFYSTEGSTLAIRAMLALSLSDAPKSTDGRHKVLAARGAHKAFITTAALLDFDVEWIASSSTHVASAAVTADDVRAALKSSDKPAAVYLTSPYYLGNISPIDEISELCHSFGVPLLVDNAHGAYLAFLEPSLHPIALGADMCCDSAHKTLPVLTGGAYLHISKNVEKYIASARARLSLFASTSPSYLILESLDLCNKYLADNYPERLSKTVARVDRLKADILRHGLTLTGSEPLKIVIEPNAFGYTGTELSKYLRERGIEVEFADSEYTVLMATPENDEEEFSRLTSAISSLPRKNAVSANPSPINPAIPKRVMSIREAMLAGCETASVSDALGRVCAAPTVSCPPAVPIAVSGEIIDRAAVELFKKYGIVSIEVVK